MWHDIYMWHDLDICSFDTISYWELYTLTQIVWCITLTVGILNCQNTCIMKMSMTPWAIVKMCLLVRTVCWSTFIHELLRTGSALVIQIFSGYMSAFELATLWLQAMLMHDVSAFLGVWSWGNCLYLMEILCNFWSVLFWKICHEYWLFLSKKCYSFLLTVVLL